MRSWRLTILATAWLLAGAASARAQTVTDERVWFILSLQEQGNADTPWRWHVEILARSRDGLGTLDVIGLRPIVIYALTARTSVGGGYAVSPGFPASGGVSVEQRAFGQLIWVARAAGGSLSLRTRVESRFIEGNSGAIGRVREQVRFSRPLRASSRVALVLSDELFAHTNDTTRLARGIEQNRVSIGLSFSPVPTARIEAAYLNQFSPGHRGAADRMNHVLSTALSFAF